MTLNIGTLSGIIDLDHPERLRVPKRWATNVQDLVMIDRTYILFSNRWNCSRGMPGIDILESPIPALDHTLTTSQLVTRHAHHGNPLTLVN